MLNILYYVYTFGRLECSSELNYVPLKLSEFLPILYFSNECGCVYGEQSTFAFLGGFGILNIHIIRWTSAAAVVMG